MRIMISVILLAFCILTPISAIQLKPSINYETSDTHAPLYLELDLNHSFDIAKLSAVYTVGYDFRNTTAYNTLDLSFALQFNWGTIKLSNKFGSTHITRFRVEF